MFPFFLLFPLSFCPYFLFVLSSSCLLLLLAFFHVLSFCPSLCLCLMQRTAFPLPSFFLPSFHSTLPSIVPFPLFFLSLPLPPRLLAVFSAFIPSHPSVVVPVSLLFPIFLFVRCSVLVTPLLSHAPSCSSSTANPNPVDLHPHHRPVNLILIHGLRHVQYDLYHFHTEQFLHFHLRVRLLHLLFSTASSSFS